MKPTAASAVSVAAFVIAAASSAALASNSPGALPADRSSWTNGLPGVLAEIAPGVRVPAEHLPCANCHGFDAAGGGEGATYAPDIGATSLLERGYDQEGLIRAIRSGVRPDGTRLARAMPRYGIDDNTGARLFEHLGVLEVQRRAGITRDEVRFAVAFDPEERFGRTLAEAYLEEASSLPEVFGRRIELILHPIDDVQSAHAVADDVVAVLGLATKRVELVNAFQAAAVPLIHPLIPQGPLKPIEPIPLGMTLGEELAALARYARAQGIEAVRLPAPSEQYAHLMTQAEVALAGVGIAVDPDAPAVLLLAADKRTLPSLALPVNASVLAPSALMARLAPEIERLHLRAVAVDPIPAMKVSRSGPHRAFAAASLEFVLRALADAGRDLTRRTLLEAARERRVRELYER